MTAFLSDNTATVAPKILAALAAANQRTTGYGDDPFSDQLTTALSELFERPVAVFPVISGTAANALALATLCPPWGAILCHEEAHIERDECGAPEFYTGGAKLVLAGGTGAKVTPQSFDEALSIFHPMVHMVQPQVLSLTQATELGTVYTVAEVAALADRARARGMRVHMDGARFANAIAYLGCAPADVTWRAGVDMLSFGATKNGAMGAEAVVVFDPALAGDIAYRRKRAGHLLSKQRYVSAQLLAYVEAGLWLRNATRANALARELATAAGSSLLHPVESNELFLQLTAQQVTKLRAQGFGFYDWGAQGSNQIRLVVSWDQDAADVTALAAALAGFGL